MKKTLRLSAGLFSFSLFISNAFAFGLPQTVASVDLARFAGTWYEVARNPIVFEPTCACARQVLTPRADGKVDVYNSCNEGSPSGNLREIRGTAEATDSSGAKLSVDFGFFWSGDYWIVGLAPDYSYAVVTDRIGYSLYILSRTPEMDPALYDQALKDAAAQVSISRLVVQPKQVCSYPTAMWR
ncbi:lipocalin family protein [bacterium]|jgi:apolipoprotein D and lipocalin family protein|nr:lipocalin family protein [bacterium]